MMELMKETLVSEYSGKNRVTASCPSFPETFLVLELKNLKLHSESPSVLCKAEMLVIVVTMLPIEHYTVTELAVTILLCKKTKRCGFCCNS